MKTETHTPGPWQVATNWPFPDERGMTHTAVTKKCGQDEVLICSFEHSAFRDSENMNASLIASAPELAAENTRLSTLNTELLAALRLLVRSYKRNGAIALQVAEVAIAKAEQR